MTTVSSTNIFAGAYVDRSGHLRRDPDWLADAINSPDRNMKTTGLCQ